MIYQYIHIFAKKFGLYEDRVVVAEIEASDILEADAICRELCEFCPAKTPMISTDIKTCFSFNPFIQPSLETLPWLLPPGFQ